MTPKRVSQSINAHVEQATRTKVGITRYATQSETDEGSVADAAITPASINNILNKLEKAINQATPTGMIAWYPAANPPPGWIKCDGRRIYPEGNTEDLYYVLLDVKDSPWSPSNTPGVAVRVPDLRGRFIRGHNMDTDRNPDEDGFGSYQNDSFQEHTHNVDDPKHNHSFEGYRLEEGANESSKAIIDDDRASVVRDDDDAIQDSSTGISLNETGGVETRPKNINLTPCIKL
jgi:hypothetical protein